MLIQHTQCVRVHMCLQGDERLLTLAASLGFYEASVAITHVAPSAIQEEEGVSMCVCVCATTATHSQHVCAGIVVCVWIASTGCPCLLTECMFVCTNGTPCPCVYAHWFSSVVIYELAVLVH